jgi:hypothetical protein
VRTPALPTLLERDVHGWTSKWSTRGERKKWTFVKQILMVHARGPCRRPRVDDAEVHASLVWATQKKNVHYFEKILTLGGFEP